MKKTTLTLFILLVTVVNSYAQSFDSKRADKYFKRSFYKEAIPLYEKSLKEKPSYHIIKNLADSYYRIYNMKKAVFCYKLLIKYHEKKVTEPYYIKYAEALKAMNKHKIANNLLKKFYKKTNNIKKLKELDSTIKYLENVKAIGQRYSIKNLAINTEQSEFGAVVKGGNLIFTAAKKEKNNKIYKWDGQPYFDLYKIPLNKVSSGNEFTKNLSSTINTKLHETNVVFTKDGKTAFFTRNNYIKNKRKKDDLKITHVQIFKAELINGKWRNIQSLPFNSNNYSTEHPALSSDGKKLFFASDREGGYGSFDIYYAQLYNDGTIGEPENLGPIINTAKKEQFPFISKKNELYFSSNGHPGFGSLDVFVSIIKKNKFLKPNNVGLPVNSTRDDFSFNIDTNTKEGYFASNRPNGKGKDDIYELIEQKPLIIENCKQIINGTITDIDSHKVLVNGLVEIGSNQQKLISVYTDNKGRYSFNAECGITYNVIVSKEGFFEGQKVMKTSYIRNKKIDGSLSLKSLAQVKIEKTAALEKDRAKEIAFKKEQQKKIRLEQKQKIAKTIAKEKNIIVEKGRIIVKTEDINFDYTLWYLRRDAKKTIDKVIFLMKKYPGMIVELGTHSDIRGKEKYNLILSQKRANAVRKYFIEQGIESNRIKAIGYGETKPIVKCKTEASCTEEQHELNRRCEFVVKKIY